MSAGYGSIQMMVPLILRQQNLGKVLRALLNKKMSNKKSINIFEYVDYRFFLSDYYAYHKGNQRGFTYRSFARSANVTASLLKDILNGRQNLSIAVMEKYAAAMQLSQKEMEYFAALVGFNNSKSNNEKNKFFSEMVRLRGRSSVKYLDFKQYEYFSKWYNAVVREMATQMEMGNAPEAMSRKIIPEVSVAKIRKSMELLADLGLIFKDENGKWTAADTVVSSEYEIESVALKNYHIEMIELAKQSIERFPADQRELQGLTLSSSRAMYKMLKERIRSFTNEILTMVADEKEKEEVVFQLNLQLFPFTQQDDDK
jgi:uncharacterized protein (TIGR02147 family)